MLTSQPADLYTPSATVHGRYLVQRGPADRLLVGFHGYAENARIHMDQMDRIPGNEQWTRLSIQALHPFYVRQNIVASWMTSQDRELAIDDNIAYVRSVVETFPQPKTLVFLGFSQGASMAYRAAANIASAGVIALSGDLAPEVRSALPPVLIGRGVRDDWYTQEKLEKDLKDLQPIAPSVTTCVYDGGHEWTDEFRDAAARFLTSCLTVSKS